MKSSGGIDEDGEVYLTSRIGWKLAGQVEDMYICIRWIVMNPSVINNKALIM